MNTEAESRRKLMAVPVMFWGSRDEARQEIEIDLLVRHTQRWDLRILAVAVQEVVNTWAWSRLPGPAHFHERCKAVVARLRTFEDRTRRAARARSYELEADEAHEMRLALTSGALRHAGPLGEAIDEIMREALDERLQPQQ